jgi:hypothetical protein
MRVVPVRTGPCPVARSGRLPRRPQREQRGRHHHGRASRADASAAPAPDGPEGVEASAGQQPPDVRSEPLRALEDGTGPPGAGRRTGSFARWHRGARSFEGPAEAPDRERTAANEMRVGAWVQHRLMRADRQAPEELAGDPEHAERGPGPNARLARGTSHRVIGRAASSPPSPRHRSTTQKDAQGTAGLARPGAMTCGRWMGPRALGNRPTGAGDPPRTAAMSSERRTK